MQVGIVCKDQESINEFIREGQNKLNLSIFSNLDQCEACDLVADLDFEYKRNKTEVEKFANANQSRLIIVNSVCTTLEKFPANVIRINGWKTFLNRPVVEASSESVEWQNKANDFFAVTGRKVEWVPDVPGFLSARVISMIINEAYFTLQDKISSREEIDIAMKLGTNYPYGPFEWSKLIGLKNISRLLQVLEKTNPRYAPCELLLSEANS